jgi:hypothetical protein
MQAQVEPIDGFIVPRAGWGADETLRFEDHDPTKRQLWPPRYQPIEKIILHHTATDNEPPDVVAAIRSIYYFHAVTRGWGDIGYNFVVDHAGKVYEGRYGGPNVIGGHALRYNPGSMGVSLLGNFDLADPPKAMIDAFVRLVKTRAPHVDVTTASDFVDLLGLANLCGHGDVLPTACPGEHCLPLLPAIRGQIAGTGPVELPPPVRIEWLEVIDCTIGPSTLYPETLLEARVTVENTGITPIETAGPEPGFAYDEQGDYQKAGFPKIENTYRFGLDFSGNSGLSNPYRWGFGETIAPGERREVVGYIRMNDIATRTFSVSLVKEYAHYLIEGWYSRKIAVLAPPVAPVPASSDPTVFFFSETGHNVPGVFYRFWTEQGGLRRFGYPLTEAFEEVSETDGGRYLTQYFERARFELHPEFAGTEHHVLLGLVGVETTTTRRLEPGFATVQPFVSSDERRYFPETGHSLGGIFKRVWDERGGLPIFGYPISEEFQERSKTDGVVHTVQYFERNRFEHHPDFIGTYDEVMLGHLAREILIRRGWLPSA